MELGREAGLVAFTALPREQRGGVAERAEVVAPVGPARDWSSRDILERVAVETPQEEADVVDPVPALGLLDLPDVHRVTRVIEGALDPAHPLDRSDVGPGALRADVLEHLVPAKELEELHRVGRPAGDVPGELLEHRQRALASSVVDGLGDVGADANGHGRPETRASQVGEELGGGVGEAIRLASNSRLFETRSPM